MRDNNGIDIELLPIGYGEIQITKDITNHKYSYKLISSNNNFKKLVTGQTSADNEDFSLCEELEKELFSQKKLKSYYNVLLNHSFMEFQQDCLSIKKRLIIKLKPTNDNLLSITLVTIPSKTTNSVKREQAPDYRKILDSSFDYILIYDSNFTLIFSNQKAKNLLGINEEKRLLSNSLEFIHPDDQRLALGIRKKLINTPGEEITSVIRILNIDKEYLVMRFLAKNMLDVDGINGIVINAINITNQKNTENRILDNQLYLESLFKAIPNLIFVLDYAGTFLDFKSQNNPKLALTPNEFLGKNISVLFPEYISTKVISALQQLKIKNKVLPISYQYKNKSADIGYYECHLSIINDEKVLAIINDVTALKKAEEELTKNQKLIQKKLDAIISPQETLADIELSDLVDLDELRDLFQTINDFTKVPISLIDKAGIKIFSIDSRSLCNDFLLKNKISFKLCSDSNIIDSQNLNLGESKLQKCLNNVWNLICPIHVGGQQIATLKICQFRLADDENNYEEMLRHQANTHGFNKEAYLEAYYSLPILEKKQLLKISTYYRDLLSKITSLSYAQIKQARTANQLKLREEKLREITDNMTDVIYTMDLEMNITYVSPSVEKLFGFTPSEYKKRTIQDKFPSSSAKIIQDTIRRGLSLPNDASKNVLFEFQEYDKNHKLIDISFHAKILKDSNNKPIGVIGSARDITKEKEIEAKLNEQLKLQTILSSIAMQYINIPINKIKDAIPESLKQFAQFSNADRAYIFNYNWDNNTIYNSYEWCKDGIKPEINNRQNIPIAPLEEWNKNQRAGKSILINNVHELSDDDETKHFLTNKNIKSVISIPLMHNNECSGFVGFDSIREVHHYSENEITMLKIFAQLLVNINNRVSMAEELSSEKERANESSKLKSSLLKNIGHELRTPLNGIIGLSELLQAQIIDPELLSVCNMIFSSGVRLNNVLDSIMLLSQLESLTAAKSVLLSKIDLSSFVKKILEQFKSQIEQKGLDLFIDIKPNLNVNIDENLFRQAIIHIINNAVKYTKKGFIKVSCAFCPDSCTVEIVIEDSGIGIPADSQELIFSDFRQVSEGYNRAYEGCGLGLPISKRAIELMNGSIILESDLEHGSKFLISLPCISRTEEINKPANVSSETSSKELTDEELSESQPQKPLILIVEDNRVNQKLATSILKQDYETDSALDGETAIAMTTQKQYDAILMDIHLGEGLDGLEVTKIIRDDIRYRLTPIIAVTGYTMLGDEEHILSQGCDYYLAKPFNRGQLLDILELALK